MKAWLVGAAVAALLAGAPAMAQTSSSSGASQPSYGAQQSGGGAAVSGTSQGDQTQTQSPRKHRAARSHRGSASQAAQGKGQGSDDQATEQLNRDELQRLQQSSR
jgi:hypothetical protein